MNKRLQNKIEKIMDKATKEMAIAAADEIHSHFIAEVDRFYNDYKTPKYYKRTKSLYKASSYYYKKMRSESIKKSSDGSYEAKIIISPKNIPNDPYKRERTGKDDITKDWIVPRSLGDADRNSRSIHGFTSKELQRWKQEGRAPRAKRAPRVLRPSVILSMNRWWKTYKKSDDFLEKLREIGLNAIKTYTVKSFRR